MDSITAMAEQLGQRLQAIAAHVATAESCTGGGIAEAITRVAGSSAWFEAGFVTYSNEQKTRQLDVPPQLFEQVGAVSREVVEAMVSAARDKADARFAVAVSGIAGPGGGSEEKPVGTVWLAWCDGPSIHARRCHFLGDRQTVRLRTVEQALDGLLRLTAGENPSRG
ncbi:CinA family protein [Pseudomonas sp. LRF_L74]|uniref:CinA family protein n=1 Tax=Pseudomonas sp. LRF_L74 TaxID=3369422 RepID=UPI003F60547D